MREIARTAGTPTFVYSRATLEGHLDRLREAFAPIDPLICYSVKSCGNLSVLRTLAARGAGMDVVSIGELQRALEAGVPASRCVYAGVGKRDDEIAAAIASGLGHVFEWIIHTIACSLTSACLPLRLCTRVDGFYLTESHMRRDTLLIKNLH